MKWKAGVDRDSPSTRNAPPPSEPPPHAAMSEVDRLAVHERATADDALDAASFAFSDRFFGHAALAERPMQPHSADPALATLTHELDGDGGMCGDHDAVDRPGNGAEVRITPRAFDLGGTRVDRERFVPRVPQFSIDGVRGLSRLSRHASNGDAPSTEELGDGLG